VKEILISKVHVLTQRLLLFLDPFDLSLLPPPHFKIFLKNERRSLPPEAAPLLALSLPKDIC
jgi:hypothetical protein